MNIPEDLLEQADHLAGRESRRPRQASLRRATSAAYYALFHLLIREACGRFFPVGELRALAARAFGHGDMKKLCRTVLQKTIPPQLKPVLGEPPPNDLRVVAEVFIKLQDSRHDADYALSLRYSRNATRLLIQSARDAFAAWERVKRDPAADAFLLGLLLGDRWNR